MAQACRPSVPGQHNPGLQLGAVLGAAWQQARDKITLLCSPPIQALGAWIEQLLAESTGKDGKALIPVNGEKAGAPQHYGADRLFVYLRLSNEADSEQDRAADDLRAAGHPVVQIDIDDRYTLGAELFRWEFATAVAGSVMGINAFDQPDVESAKQAARTLAEAFERDGHLPRREPVLDDEAVQIFATDSYRTQLTGSRDASTAAALLTAHFNQLGLGDYFALLAYANRLDIPLYTQLQRLRHAVRDRYRSATCLGYGPRYLHSTGQAHKGGPNTGVFLIATLDSETDLVIPGHRPGFSVIESAQAEGDFLALSDKARRVLRIHFKGERLNALITLESIIQHIESNRATY